ncbi:hypothetical protein ACFC60_36160, partial [Kitasatospora purpeofusca]
MGSWTSVSKLSLVLETGEHQSQIEHDGKDTKGMGVVVTIQPTDSDGNPVKLSDDELNKAQVDLIDYVDEKPMPTERGSNNGWYCLRAGASRPRKDGTLIQFMYTVSWGTGNSYLHAKSIGVSVAIGSKVVYSSLSGTY